MKRFTDKIFNIQTECDFDELALQAFDFQMENNPIYAEYVSHLNILPKRVSSVEKIPCLPIEFFKKKNIITKNLRPELIFTSSGTSGMQTSKHLVASPELYEQSFQHCFRTFYGEPSEYVFLALLPSYLERKGSSLVYMVERLIEDSHNPKSNFFLHNMNELAEVLQKLEDEGKKSILLGVSFALIDFFEAHDFQLKNTIIMETGGMKGRKEEMVREELHDFLCKRSGVSTIHSEYGMTELLSQAYSDGHGIFRTPKHMRILIRDTNDPFERLPNGKTGGVNVIDLANIYSCPFVETMDLGKKHSTNMFEILGRFDNSDVRGCNLMVV